MDYIFLLDISGSMADDGKLLLSKDSVNAFINELDAEDRFEVVTFNVQPNLAFRSLKPADAANKSAAENYLAHASARGGTVLAPALTTAFRYSTQDRPLNIIILSDGLTEQRDRATLLQLNQQRPGNTRIFCIGVGNDVNKQMLEQVAEQAGGLAAFISRGDNFERQAKAFRRKLTRPAATGLEIKFSGVEVYDVEPVQLPNLYHGSPVRLYGRYKGTGEANVELRASINGREFKQSAPFTFAKEDLSNPELERMWAWKRIDGILKVADAKGNRAPVIDEVVRLGELYSIVTEYTSFLVLENDSEYQRWKIARSNLKRIDQDRNAQLAVSKKFETLRNKALTDIGPEAVGAAPAKSEDAANSPVAANPASSSSATPASTPTQVAQAPNRSQSFNLGGGGGGAVGPLFVLAAFLCRKFGRRSK